MKRAAVGVRSACVLLSMLHLSTLIQEGFFLPCITAGMVGVANLPEVIPVDPSLGGLQLPWDLHKWRLWTVGRLSYGPRL